MSPSTRLRCLPARAIPSENWLLWRSLGYAMDPVLTPHNWLIKSEPFVYSWSQLVKDGVTRWDGVRNFEARNNLRAMRLADRCLFYHSNEGKEVVGVATVVRTHYPEPGVDGDWSCVDVAPLVALAKPVSLAAIKAHGALSAMQMLRRNRLSVTSVTAAEFEVLLAMGATVLPDPR